MSLGTTTAMKNILAAAYAAAATHAALFTSDPGTTGSATGEVTGGTYAREPITWSAPSNGTVTGQVVFNVPTGTDLTFSAVCGGLTGANVLDKGPLTQQPFNTDGTYTLDVSYTQS